MVNALLTIMDRYRERKPCYTRCHFVTLMIFGKLHYLLKWQNNCNSLFELFPATLSLNTSTSTISTINETQGICAPTFVPYIPL